MAEFCHVCDLFRTALFGPTNSHEDHLDDGLGNDLPRPMADAPATLGARTRSRPGGVATTAKPRANPDAIAQPHVPGTGATASPTWEVTAPVSTTAHVGASGASAERAGGEAVPAQPAVAAAAAAAAPAAASTTMPAGKPPPKTKFSKRAPRGLKASPAYMSFDDVDVEDDDSDGELFMEDSRDRRNSGSRSPHSMAAAAAAGSAAYSVNAPSVYREPRLPAPAPAPALAPAATVPEPDHVAPTAPHSDAPLAPAYDSFAGESAFEDTDGVAGVNGGGAIRGGEEYIAVSGGVGLGRRGSHNGGVQESDGGGSVSSRGGIAGDSPMEAYGGKGALKLGGGGVAGERVSITRDGSMLESARPHGQSESFHGYRGYPGYEPDTPVASQLSEPGHSADGLTIGPGADVSDPRLKKSQGAPTPSSVRYHEPLAGASAMDPAMPEARLLPAVDSDFAEQPQQQQQQQSQPHSQQHPAASPTSTMDMPSVAGGSQLGGAAVYVSSAKQQQQQQYAQQQQQQHPPHVNLGAGLSYEAGSAMGSAYRASPSNSVANSMASSFRRDESRHMINQQPSEDGIGSVLGTLTGTEDSTNEDLQWKRSALKKFHKVMVKGEGLRVVKHNRSGGSQMRIIRYDPDMKALVWNSKRYMKKAGSANVPIVGIKRVGREGNTVSVTAAGRGTIGFEPQRIRDAKILAEALRALVDKEERSAMWRG